ncbi:MAG: hypothetical protein KKA07_01255 [Bacteroidetes bacterium]|nr:hypothetical protein [Bacteroidota bacterium]MBU1717676.1 hypothetical protein [Bacteroidota bacterium]
MKTLFLSLNLIILPLFFNICFAQQSALDDFKTGDIIISDNGSIANDKYGLSSKPYDEFVAGIFHEEKQDNPRLRKYPIKREGIYLVKFNSENGPIKKGDIVTTSSEPGVAMKATESGMIIGIALEDANGESGLVKIRILIQYVK